MYDAKCVFVFLFAACISSLVYMLICHLYIFFAEELLTIFALFFFLPGFFFPLGILCQCDSIAPSRVYLFYFYFFFPFLFRKWVKNRKRVRETERRKRDTTAWLYPLRSLLFCWYWPRAWAPSVVPVRWAISWPFFQLLASLFVFLLVNFWILCISYMQPLYQISVCKYFLQSLACLFVVLLSDFFFTEKF